MSARGNASHRPVSRATVRTVDARMRELRSHNRLENTPGFASVLDSNGEIVEASDPLLQFLGKTLTEVRDCAFSGFTHPDDFPGASALFQRAVASGETYEVDQRLRSSSAHYRWFRASVIPLRSEQERADLWYVLLLDIDDRKRVDVDLIERERELRRNEALIAEGERLSHTGSFYWDTQTNQVLYSDEGYRIHEIELGTPIDLALLSSRIHPEDRPLLDQKIAAGRNARGDLDYSIRLKLPSGRVSWIHTTARRFENEPGKVEYVGAVQDITDRYQAEEALSKLRTEMAHVSRVSSLGALTASIAHEVNQPLTGIITNASTGLRALNINPPNVTHALETVRRTLRDANRAAEVVARLRAMFSKKEADFEPVDLNAAVKEIMSLSATELQVNRVIVHTELNSALPVILGDRVQLQQVILNLILNATDAMTDVTTRSRQLIVRTDVRPDATLRLSVHDSGTGVDPEQVDKLFEPFHTTKAKGMGIGLFVSRSIIERHGGRLWAERNEPHGARFSFSIPLPRS